MGFEEKEKKEKAKIPDKDVSEWIKSLWEGG